MPDTEMVYETKHDDDIQEADSSDPEYELEPRSNRTSGSVGRPRKTPGTGEIRRGGRRKDDVWNRFTQQMIEGRSVATCNCCGQHMFPRAYSCKLHLTKCTASPENVAAVAVAKPKLVTPSTRPQRIRGVPLKIRRTADTIAVASISQIGGTPQAEDFQGTQVQYEVLAAVGTPPNPKFPSTYRLGVIGGGVMAKSILFPLFEQGLMDAYNVIVAGITVETLQAWSDRGCTAVTNNNSKVFDEAHVILWALKAEVFPKAIELLINEYAERSVKQPVELNLPLHISAIGGITIEQFTDRLGTVHEGHTAVIPRTVRAMPNIGHRVSVGTTIFALGLNTDDDDRKIVHSIFASTGICLEVPEGQVNIFGALTGSGIGFMFPVIEAMADGALKVGVKRELAHKMAAQTMRAAAELYIKEAKHPGALKDLTCTPGGPTSAGIAELENAGVRIGFIKALDAANKRSEEIGKLV